MFKLATVFGVLVPWAMGLQLGTPMNLRRLRRKCTVYAMRTLSLPAGALHLDDPAPDDHGRFASPLEFSLGAGGSDTFRVPGLDMKGVMKGLREWHAPEFRVAVVAGSFAAYPALVGALSVVPPPNAAEGGYFFSLMSIVFATLSAATISDAGDRIKALRMASVEEASLLLPLERRLEALLADVDFDEATPEAKEVFQTCARLLWDHSSDLIHGNREDELRAIADDADKLMTLVETLQKAQGEWSKTGGPDVSFALAATERIVEARGKRLSLESFEIEPMQFDVLNVLSCALVLAYAYLTMDSAPPPHVLGFVMDATRGFVFDSSFGAHALFSMVCGALAVFNSLASDLNKPFDGTNKNKLESGTVEASLKQLRKGLAKHVGRSTIALSPRNKKRGDPPPAFFP